MRAFDVTGVARRNFEHNVVRDEFLCTWHSCARADAVAARLAFKFTTM